MASDLVDQGSEVSELFLRAALSNKKPHTSLMAVGACHYCSEGVIPGLLFCPGGECSDDWEREQRIKQRNGLT